MLPSPNGWALATLAALSLWLVGPDVGHAATAATGTDFPQAVLAIASLLQLAISAWVVLVIGLAQVRGSSRLVRAITPGVLRRALFVGAAGALAITPASADRGSSAARVTADSVTADWHSLDGLALPDRPVILDDPAERVIVVRPGDTLWAIAARSLPAGASNRQVAASCARWYAANRAVIGDDPGLIRPSQRLTPPAKDSV